MIASDQITLFNGVVREKPENEEEVGSFEMIIKIIINSFSFILLYGLF